MTETLRRLVEHPLAERVIIALIVLNAVILGLETSPSVMAQAGPLLVALDTVLLAVFVVEIVARILVHRLRFFRDPWALFDFAVVGIAIVPATQGLSVLRALRILRVLRMITVVPSLKRVVGALAGALPGMGSIILLLGLLFYVYSVMATKLFGASFPEWFGSMGASAYSLFQIMTLESWSMGIARPVMEVYPYAWLFFIAFILTTTMTMLNLFVGVVVSAMQEAHELPDPHHDEVLLREIALLRDEVRALRREQAGNVSSTA